MYDLAAPSVAASPDDLAVCSAMRAAKIEDEVDDMLDARLDSALVAREISDDREILREFSIASALETSLNCADLKMLSAAMALDSSEATSESVYALSGASIVLALTDFELPLVLTRRRSFGSNAVVFSVNWFNFLLITFLFILMNHFKVIKFRRNQA